MALDCGSLLCFNSSVRAKYVFQVRLSVTFAGVLAFACSDPQATPSPEPVEQFTWTHTWGPCLEAETPCLESLRVSGSLVLQNLRGVTRETTLPPAAAQDLDAFLVDEDLRATIANPAPCGPENVIDSVVTVEVRTVSGHTTLSKNLAFCEGPSLDRLEDQVATLRNLFEP